MEGVVPSVRVVCIYASTMVIAMNSGVSLQFPNVPLPTNLLKFYGPLVGKITINF